MPKLDEAREFLMNVGMPKAQQADICALSILAMAGIKPDSDWKDATNEWIRIHDIIAFANQHYGTTYAENSRETFRKQAMHHFRNAALIEDNGKSTIFQCYVAFRSVWNRRMAFFMAKCFN